MNTSKFYESLKPYRGAATNALALVGFIAIIGIGIWGAVYSSRFVPDTVGRLGEAAVYVGTLFSPTPEPNKLAVIDTASSTVISFGNPTPVAASTTATTTSTVRKPSATVPVQPIVTRTYVAQAPYGLADLAVTPNAVGYLTSESTDTFIASTTVPAGYRPAVKFTIVNSGTNWTGTWRFTADLPISRSPIAAGFEKCEQLNSSTQRCTSYAQQSLNSGGSIAYTLGYDRASSGLNQPVTIVANFDKSLAESNSKNNEASFALNIL